MELVTGTATVEDVESFVADLESVGEANGCAVQAFDARYVADRTHLERAVERADRAIERGENVARERAVEILLYAAGRRQIDRALEMGVDEGTSEVVVLVAADPGADDSGADRPAERERAAAAAVRDLPAIAAGPVEIGDPSVLCDFFGITDAEREATTADLAALVGERVALLDVEK